MWIILGWGIQFGNVAGTHLDDQFASTLHSICTEYVRGSSALMVYNAEELNGSIFVPRIQGGPDSETPCQALVSSGKAQFNLMLKLVEQPCIL